MDSIARFGEKCPHAGDCVAVCVCALLTLAATNPHAEHKHDGGKSPQSDPSPPTYGPYPNLNDKACYQAQNHDAADLCAQWRAAIAAEKAASATETATKWSEAATVLSALALAALIWTLLQTEKTLGEARRSNEISEETARRQLRAYVMAKSFRIDGLVPGGRPTIVYEIINVGQTPAYDVYHSAKVFVGLSLEGMSTEKVHFAGKPPIMSRATLGVKTSGESSFDAFPPNSFTDELCQQIIAGQIVVGVFGAISYRDIFKRRHITTFKKMLRPDRIKDGAGIFFSCEKGNRAN